jgi:hypothetical protein
MSVRVVCIDDKNKPVEIPQRKWIIEGQEYHILFVVYSVPSKTMAYDLEEIELDESCMPYQHFSAKRFAIHKDDLEEFQQLVKDCTDMNDVNIEESILKYAEIHNT